MDALKINTCSINERHGLKLLIPIYLIFVLWWKSFTVPDTKVAPFSLIDVGGGFFSLPAYRFFFFFKVVLI
jgi:hypothetical protein